MAFIATLFTLILPVLIWLWYGIRAEKGWLYLFYGFGIYLALQLILRLSFLVVLNALFGFADRIPAVVSSLINILLNEGGLFLIFWVFYRPKITALKATGIALGYGLFEPVILFGVNCLLSILLSMPLESASYSGAIIESLYLAVSLFCLISLMAFCLQENRWKILVITFLFYALLTLINPWLLGINGSVWWEWIVLLLESLLWVFGFWKWGFLFYSDFFTELLPFLKKKSQSHK